MKYFKFVIVYIMIYSLLFSALIGAKLVLSHPNVRGGTIKTVDDSKRQLETIKKGGERKLNLALGLRCSINSQCASGYCYDGYCQRRYYYPTYYYPTYYYPRSYYNPGILFISF